ncbi:cell division ATP-binding protein FtsE [Saccharicrinis sp. FJH2]|uniref:cell division ATP-binding protein FtsE n=2 Tax=unclassified Saccharicrinis TaxID=2646859 RepID=UPI0035F22D87
MDNEEVVIRLQDAEISHRELVVLKNVNLEVKKGEFIYLTGKTGTGKSSLLRTLYADIPLLNGEGEVAGYDLKKLKNREIPYLRRKIGIVFQDFQLLYDRNVSANLEFVLKATNWKDKKKIENRINEVLDHVGMKNKGYKKPHELSGGEQQRIAIARALLNKPELILADEPTGNLDFETSTQIMKILKQIRDEGTTILMATHNSSLLEVFPGRVINFQESILVDNAG